MDKGNSKKMTNQDMHFQKKQQIDFKSIHMFRSLLTVHFGQEYKTTAFRRNEKKEPLLCIQLNFIQQNY